jgi:hypothetical protein
MGMDLMAAGQGMFGGFGMNMSDMSNGMNMGMNYDAGQGMYGGWDNSQNTMWNGGQDNYNPTAFANGMGPDYGASGFAGGYNMSQPNGNYSQMQRPSHFPNQDYQNGYYGHGPGYGRGMGRGRGRGFYQGGRGRGFFNTNPHYLGDHTNHAAFANHVPHEGPPSQQVAPSEADIKKFNDELAPGGGDDLTDVTPKEDPTVAPASASESREVEKPDDKPEETNTTEKEASAPESEQLQGIPTIESIDQASSPPAAIPTGPTQIMEPGFGRGRPPMRGGFYGGRGGYPNGAFYGPPMPGMGKGVEGAPAAPRAMREGFPNTSMRGRGFPIHSRGSMPPQRSAEPSRRYAYSHCDRFKVSNLYFQA